MMAERKMDGARIGYRPLVEGELTAEERARAYGKSDRAARMAEAQARLIAAAGKDQPGFDAHAKWVVATCRVGQERIACDELAAAKIEFWCPMSEERRPPTRGKRAETIRRPVFHGYLFVRLLPYAEAWMGALTASRLTGFMGIDGVPVCLSDRFFNSLKTNAKRPDVAHAKGGKHAAWVGRKAEVRDGPFVHFMATVKRVFANDTRVEAEVNIFGRATLCEFDIDQLKV